METIIYKPSPKNLLFRRIIGLFFAVMGGGMACVFSTVGLLFAPLLLSAETGSPENWILALFFPVVGLLFGGLFVVVGLAVAFRNRNEEIQLTGEALIHRYGKTTINLSLAAINHLKSQWRRSRRRRSLRGHWELIISDQFGQSIVLAIPQGGYLATFEVEPILKALLPRLPGSVEIDPRIQDYVATGRIS